MNVWWKISARSDGVYFSYGKYLQNDIINGSTLADLTTYVKVIVDRVHEYGLILKQFQNSNSQLYRMKYMLKTKTFQFIGKH